MEKKKDFIFIIIFVFIVGISLLYLFQASYAKYRKQISGNMTATIAHWNIKVNNETINNKTELSNYIIPVLDNNNYVKAGVIAPGSTGYFDLTINALESDVDFNYEISGEVNEDTPLLDLVITEYEIGGVRTPYDEDDKITGQITKNTNDTTIRVYFQWIDDETNQMDNQDDTSYATTYSEEDTKIKVTIKFTQKK